MSIAVLFTLTFSLLAQTTERISLAPGGVQANAECRNPCLSADARYVAFESRASNLVAGDTNSNSDVFVHDRQSGLTVRVSVDSAGVQGNGSSNSPSISADGRFIAFQSNASNLAAGDNNWVEDVFLHDRQTGDTSRISLSTLGVEGNSWSGSPSISADGRFVAFDSLADNLVFMDANFSWDVFVHDRLNGQIDRVSRSTSGLEGNWDSHYPAISANGRMVVFQSRANNLISGDLTFAEDIYIHDRELAQTSLLSISSAGVQANQPSFHPAISADGAKVAFETTADNLVVGDSNGVIDVYVHDLSNGQTVRASLASSGLQGTGDSTHASLSADGEFAAFRSEAADLVTADANQSADMFVRQIQTGLTTRASLDSIGTEGNADSGGDPLPASSISADGRYVAFESAASNLVPSDTNGTTDIFVRDLGSAADKNTIVLIGPDSSATGVRMDLAWFAAPPNSRYWLYFSPNQNGTIYAGHNFDLGSPAADIVKGRNSAAGTGSYSTPPIPTSYSGFTLYVELVALDGAGQLYDSNVHPVTFY